MKKILIAEDVALNVELLEQLLEDDYELVIVENGRDAVEKTAVHHPDLILMDMAMPIMDGYEATRQIKANPALAHIPVIGLSAHAMNGEAEKALAAGCDDYLTKPLNEDMLFDKLEAILGE